MILVIDNYDSFTYNLVQYLMELGAETMVKRNDSFEISDLASLKPDGILISPGPGDPEQAGISMDVVRYATLDCPILGVCLGHQSICEALGASIVRAPEVRHGKTSPVEHDGKGVFTDLPNPLIQTRYHSLVVDPETLPDELMITAKSKDDKLVMGVRHQYLPIEGVQFHPESILSECGHQLLGNFLNLCGKQ